MRAATRRGRLAQAPELVLDCGTATVEVFPSLRFAWNQWISARKHGYGLAPLRVHGIERVALHANLTMLARLSVALARARAVPLAALAAALSAKCG